MAAWAWQGTSQNLETARLEPHRFHRKRRAIFLAVAATKKETDTYTATPRLPDWIF